LNASPKLICYGDLCVDIFVDPDTFPQPGQDTIVHDMKFMPAGSAANCAATAARLGIPTYFLGVTGSDPLANILVDDLVANDVNVNYLRRSGSPTGVTIAILGPDRTFLSFRGANALPYGTIPTDIIKPGNFLHLSGYSFQSEHSRNTALALIEQAKKCDGCVSLDPSFHFAQEFGTQSTQYLAVLAELDFIFPNLEEARLLTGSDNPAEAAAQIRALGPKTVIVTLGEHGCYIDSDHIKAQVLPFPVDRIVDATGAGDAFCGAFLAGTMRGLNMMHAAQLGHVAAGRVIGEIGGHHDTPSLDDAIAFANQHDAELVASLLKIRAKQDRLSGKSG
jgi:ribokinase